MRRLPSCLVLFAVAAALAPGCGGRVTLTPAAPAAPLHVSTDGSRLVTRTAVSPAAIHPGETMDIAVSVENPTDDVIRITFPSSCVFRFTVADRDGKFVAPSAICLTVLVTEEWAPHETKTRHLSWNGRTGNPAPADVLPPGDYDVIGNCTTPAPPVRVTLLAP